MKIINKKYGMLFFPLLIVLGGLFYVFYIFEEPEDNYAQYASDPAACSPITGSDDLGPYYIAESPLLDDLNVLNQSGKVLRINGQVTANGNPIPNARIEIWQADADGNYLPEASGRWTDFDEKKNLRGHIVTDENGKYEFTTLYPGLYGDRARHIHYKITADGYYDLVTQNYFADDERLKKDEQSAIAGPCRVVSTTQTDKGVLEGTFDIMIEPAFLEPETTHGPLTVEDIAEVESLLTPAGTQENDNGTLRVSVRGDRFLFLEGTINSTTPEAIAKALSENPAITTVVLTSVPGSMDDEANIKTSYMIREKGLNTYIPKNGMVASGGSDLFLSGVHRQLHQTAKVGVHSWGGGIGFFSVKAGSSFPYEDSQHQLYLRYYAKMKIPTDFYWFTLRKAGVSSIHWMTPEEKKMYKIATDFFSVE